MLPRPTPFSVCLFQTSLKVRAELFELPKTDSVANFAHDVKVKVNVVVGVQNYREKFSRRIKVAEVGARVAAAHRASAGFVEGALVAYIFCIFYEQAALGSEQATVTGAARGKHAIHHVNAERDVIGNLFRPADTHQVTRAGGGKPQGSQRRHFAGDSVRLANGEAADGVAGKIEIYQRVGGFAAACVMLVVIYGGLLLAFIGLHPKGA